ncbi:hypothetical protein B0H14DRAFT_2554164 [Mycena olivaceomarginata]|nr:hypothetical protein B0H14DRAFT_2554164 [Mycena olivaceomarginata]
MSFHLLYHLGTSAVLNATITPRAYKHSKKLGWREDNTISSPSRHVVKCKAILLNLDNPSDERPDPKRTAGQETARTVGGKKRPVRAAPWAKAIASSEQWTKLLAKLILISASIS